MGRSLPAVPTADGALGCAPDDGVEWVVSDGRGAPGGDEWSDCHPDEPDAMRFWHLEWEGLDDY